MAFNPYLEWLGVNRTKPNFYRLLALEYFERSPAVIARQAAAQLEKLTPHLEGPQADVAQKVQQEIEMACAILMDTKRRKKYESLMRAQLEKAGRLPASGKESGKSQEDPGGSSPTNSPSLTTSAVEVPDEWLPPTSNYEAGIYGTGNVEETNPQSQSSTPVEPAADLDDDLPFAWENPGEWETTGAEGVDDDLPSPLQTPGSSPAPTYQAPAADYGYAADDPPEAIPLASAAPSHEPYQDYSQNYSYVAPEEPAAFQADEAQFQEMQFQEMPAAYASTTPAQAAPADLDDDLPPSLMPAAAASTTAQAHAQPQAATQPVAQPKSEPRPVAQRGGFPAISASAESKQLPWGMIGGVAAACLMMIVGILYVTNSGPFAPEQPPRPDTLVASGDPVPPAVPAGQNTANSANNNSGNSNNSGNNDSTTPNPPPQTNPPQTPANTGNNPAAGNSTSNPTTGNSTSNPDSGSSGSMTTTPAVKPETPATPENPESPPVTPETPSNPPQPETPPEPETPVEPMVAKVNPEVTKNLMAARVAMSQRDLESAETRLEQAKSLDTEKASAAEIERVSTLLYLVKGFWDAANEGVKELPIGSVTIQDITVGVVEINPEYFVLRQAGQNRRYYLRTPPSSASVGGLELAPTGLAYGLAERWFDASDPGTPLFLGAFLCVNPTSKKADAKAQWDKAAVGDYADQVAMLIPELDVKIPSSMAGIDGEPSSEPMPDPDSAPTLAQAEDGRYQVPGPSLIRIAENQMRSQFQAEFAAAQTPEQKANLAEKLYQQAQETTDPVLKYVLLEETGNLSLAGGDLNFAFLAIGEIEVEYAISGLEYKTSLLEKAARSSETPEQNKLVAEAALALVDEALLFNDLKFANQNARMALAAARKSSDSELLMKASQRQKDVADLR